ncbi:GNAT family N-acetyltransferase [Kineosporia babensis]|uniref:GNAT family N-acetyltransferase n=1 Tax=Kineosporia babensis TaxID=499548 RepID=A0A9X1NMP7_9ACTN|nr:GNAT family N-acetyltransferase [Kineosporia babensis]MCD5317205.1 GNAT family N-acetyltransferase [Kineosporia babensis]
MGGSPRTVVTTGQPLPDLDWSGEMTTLTDSWPYLGPTYLGATEKAMPEARAWHTIATRARGELALLPGYVLDSAPAVDHEPRTYLGWRAPSGEEVCCGADADAGRSAEVDALGTDPFFPSLLLGSPLGYRSEIAYNFWTPTLMASMVNALVPAALEAGVKSIVAPWIPDRRGNEALVTALEDAGASSGFWGYEDHIPLDADSWEGHLAALPVKKKRRITADLRKAEASGLDVRRIDGEQIRPHASRIAELICLNREKNGAGEEPGHILGLITALLDEGADLRAYCGFDNDVLVAVGVTIRKGHRLFTKWAGFDYDAIGDRSGIYFVLVLDAPVRDAYAEGLRVVECGAGAHRAKTLRGAQSRAMTTALLVSDASLRPTIGRWLGDFSAGRRTAFGDEPERSVPVLNLIQPGSSDGGCCSTG